MERNAFTEINPEDMKCPSIVFHKQKHGYEFVLSSFEGIFCGCVCGVC